ncbi:MAG: 2-C-methyl-D-erythritol 4-phosphate cytidylyltransferase, partial [Sphingobium sp.]
MASLDGLAAILLAAGRGERAGGGVAKQYRLLGGRSVLAHAYASLRRIAGMGPILVVVGEGEEASAAQALAPVEPSPLFVTGGAERRDSVRRAVEHLAGVDNAPGHVLVHDSAR